MKSIIVSATVAACIFTAAACKNKTSPTHTASLRVDEDDERYYAFKMKAYRDPYGQRKERQLVGTKFQDVIMQVAVKLVPGSADHRLSRDNPYIKIVNMDDPSDCLQVESNYDLDADPPIYEKGKTNANYRQRLQFHAVSPGGSHEPTQQVSLQWYWGKKFTTYGIMKKLTIKQLHQNKPTIYFLSEKTITLSPEEIKTRFFSLTANQTCQQATAAKNITRQPVQGIWHYAFTLPKYTGAGQERKLKDKKAKFALRLELNPTKGGGQHARVIVKDMNKPSTCYAFSKYAHTLDWKTHNDKLYHKHIAINKRFGNSDRYFTISWILEKNENNALTYFYFDEKTGGEYYEYTPENNLALSLPPITLTPDEIAQQYFPQPNPALNCSIPEPRHNL